VDEFGVKGGKGVIEKLLAEPNEVWIARTALHPFERGFPELSTSLTIEKTLHVAEQVDERHDLKAGKLAAKTLDQIRCDATRPMGPGRTRIGKAVFEVEAESTVAGIQAELGEALQVFVSGGLLAGDVERPHAKGHAWIIDESGS